MLHRPNSSAPLLTFSYIALKFYEQFLIFTAFYVLFTFLISCKVGLCQIDLGSIALILIIRKLRGIVTAGCHLHGQLLRCSFLGLMSS